MYDGKPGEVVLTRLVMSISRPDEWNSFGPQILAKAGEKEDRDCAMLLAILVERMTTLMLLAFLPGMEEKQANRMPVGQKIAVLRGAQLIASRIWDAAEIVMTVRNGFAHNLGTASFADLARETHENVRRIYNEWERNYAGPTAPEDPSHGFDQRLLFSSLAHFAASGIHAHIPGVMVLRAKLLSKDFADELDDMRRLITRAEFDIG